MEDPIKNPYTMKFGEGILEATMQKSDEILSDISAVLDKHNVEASVVRVVKSNSVANPDDKYHPLLSVQGEEVGIRFVTPLVDKFGNAGKVWMQPEAVDAITNAMKEAGENPDDYKIEEEEDVCETE